MIRQARCTKMNHVSALLAALLWLLCDASVGLIDVQIRKGKCVLNGTEIENGKSVNLEKPCESRTCDAKAKTVEIIGCGPIVAPPNCTLVNGTGIFPKCCRHAVCKRTGLKPVNITALLSSLTKC
ncbi:U-scoloptoxin(16)-Sm3a isoform X1 [Dermacentor andersoni]|uniref:U-scoloptoxin(16)-Sm3a isoform X1 n=2 Tax=Dermacentor andersoni TaxID=34620 RepID=UPI00241715DD|nr:U-scoloptoxin(16)-Sm3a-like isoform X1 [Dermacentor andersoni]